MIIERQYVNFNTLINTDARAKEITEEMKIEASKAIANVISDQELNKDYIIPSPFDERVVNRVSESIKNIILK